MLPRVAKLPLEARWFAFVGRPRDCQAAPVAVQSNWVYKRHLALGKVFAAGPSKRLMVRDAASSKPCVPLLLARAGARAGVQTPAKNPKESGDFAALLKRIVAKNGF